MRALILTLLLAPAITWADDPKFEHRDPSKPAAPEEPATVYKANVQFGATMIKGNAESIGFSAAGLGSIRHYRNAFELFAQGAYAKAAFSSRGEGGPLDSEKEAAKNWLYRLRYDRFFSERNALFVIYGMAGDPLAGFDYRIEPQIGYSRLFIKRSYLLFRGELGYDYTFDHYLAGTDPRTQQFHSVRAFLGFEYKISEWAAFLEGLEALWAVNDIEHVRLNSLTSLSATITKRVSLKVNLTMKANFDPPNRPAAIGGQYDKLDTILDAALAITLL